MDDLIFEKLIQEEAVVSVISNGVKQDWYLVPIDYWVMNHWGQWGISWEDSDKEKCVAFLKLIQEYKVDLE